MALPTKPDMTHVWASGGAKVAPSNTKIDGGWGPEVPPFQWENWSQNRQDAFLAHINISGFPVWDGLTNYEAAGQSLTKGSDGKIYKSVAASGPSTTVQDPVTDVSDTYWTIAFADVGAFLTQATADTRYTQRANNLSDVTNAATARNNLGVTNAVEGGLSNSFSGLMLTTTGTNSVVTITATSVCVKNAAFQQKVLNNVSVSPTFATAGAGGLDVGAANSQAAITWYYTWIIWNGTTTSSLLSLSSTLPTLPSGYTHYARVGAVRTDGTANKYPLSIIQNGKVVWYKPASGSNTTAPPPVATGAITWPTAVGISAFVPPTATQIRLNGYLLAVSQQLFAAPNNSYTTTNAPIFQTNSSNGGTFSSTTQIPLESATITYGATTQTTLYCYGWEDNL